MKRRTDLKNKYIRHITVKVPFDVRYNYDVPGAAYLGRVEFYRANFYDLQKSYK